VASGVEGNGFSRCLVERLGAVLGGLGPGVAEALRREGWRSLEWQRVKRRIAEAIAGCICSLLGRSVYLTDLHGGEPSEGLGDKDIDLVIECLGPGEAARLEQVAEERVAEALARLLGGDPYSVLGVPNIVELHSSHEFLAARLLRAGAPYVENVCSGQRG